nr:MAG TPA: hypothetical protein [Caudoviricetes sp.]
MSCNLYGGMSHDVSPFYICIPHAAHSQLDYLNDNTSVETYVLRILINKTFV